MDKENKRVKEATLRGPLYLLFLLVISLFLVESVTMWFLYHHVHLAPRTEGLIDAFVLTVIIYPVLYFLMYRPLVSYISGLRRAEAQLKQTHEDLKKSHEALKAAQLQLIHTEKMDSVGRLAAGVAHEVKNPLATIQMAITYLSKHLSTDRRETREALEDVESAVKKADSIIRGLLDFSAPKPLAMKTESLNPVVENALSLVRHHLDKANIQLATFLSDNLPSLKLDKDKIEQLFVNLFMNAIQAMPQGGTLTVKTSAKRLTDGGVRVGLRATDRFRTGETVVVSEIEDTGTGIPEEKLSKVFDPFFTTKPPGQGTGLGLTVASQIIEMHRGAIEIQNRKEGGVKVTLLFKVAWQ